MLSTFLISRASYISCICWMSSVYWIFWMFWSSFTASICWISVEGSFLSGLPGLKEPPEGCALDAVIRSAREIPRGRSPEGGF